MNFESVSSGHVDQLGKDEEDGLMKPHGISNRFLFPVPVSTVHSVWSRIKIK